MGRGRLEAFSDGVLAIIITIMVLELKVPHDASIEALLPLAPVFLSYVLSFLYVGIYWNNYHHLLHTVTKVNGPVLWANMGLLFWLSLLPFATAWMGENHFGKWPMVLYGIVLFMAALFYFLLTKALVRIHGNESVVVKAVGNDFKEKISLFIYSAALVSSFFIPYLGFALYFVVAIIWLIPDRRVERTINE